MAECSDEFIDDDDISILAEEIVSRAQQLLIKPEPRDSEAAVSSPRRQPGELPRTKSGDSPRRKPTVKEIDPPASPWRHPPSIGTASPRRLRVRWEDQADDNSPGSTPPLMVSAIKTTVAPSVEPQASYNTNKRHLLFTNKRYRQIVDFHDLS